MAHRSRVRCSSLLKDPGFRCSAKDGKVPAEREEKKEDPTATEKKDDTKPAPAKPADEFKDAPKVNGAPGTTATPPTPAPATPATPATPADKKEEPKKEEKKTSSAESSSGSSLAEENDPLVPSQHLSYAQMQQLLKQGKPAFCQCPRCVNGAKAIGAKLSE